MKYTHLIFALLIIGVFSCKDRGLSKNNADCGTLERLSADDFLEASTEIYTLESVKQEGGNVLIELNSGISKDASARLVWTGAIRKSYPAQATVKILFEGEMGPKEKKQAFCFDISSIGELADRVDIYFLDDEEILQAKFE